MADFEEKFKKLQQYVRSILPELQKVPKLEEEIEQLKMSHSEELEQQRSALETRQENKEKERDDLKAEKEKFQAAMKAEKEKMRRMKEKLQEIEASMNNSKRCWEEERSKQEKEMQEKFETAMKLLQGERNKLMEEKNLVQVSTKKMLEDRRLIEEDKNMVLVKLRSIEEKEKKLEDDAKILSKARGELKEERNKNKRIYEEKARKLEEERKELDKEVEALEKERLYIDEDWQLINDWKDSHGTGLTADLEVKVLKPPNEQPVDEQNFTIDLNPTEDDLNVTPTKVATFDEQSLAIDLNPTKDEAPKRKRGRPRKDGGLQKKIKIKPESVISLDPDFFADSPEVVSPSPLDLHYQELLKIEEDDTKYPQSNLSARQLLDEVSLLL